MATTKLDPRHEAILSALSALDVSDAEIERRAGPDVAGRFLSKARKGEREGPRSAPAWNALARVAGLPEEDTPPTAAATDPEGVPSALVLAIRDANDLESLDDLACRVAEELAAGSITPNTCRAMTELVRERRQ